MKEKIFTMGKVYDLSTLGVNEVENAVQADLDKVFNAGGVRFKLREVSGKTLELTFFRKYREGEIDWLNYDPKMIYNIDANIITGQDTGLLGRSSIRVHVFHVEERIYRVL